MKHRPILRKMNEKIKRIILKFSYNLLTKVNLLCYNLQKQRLKMGLARYYMSKIDRKIQSNIAKAKCRDERGRFVKKRACQNHTHSQPSRDKTPLSFAYFFAFVLLFTLLAAAVFVFVGCAGPRSATMCIKNGDYVKCPKGVEVGTELK